MTLGWRLVGLAVVLLSPSVGLAGLTANISGGIVASGGLGSTPTGVTVCSSGCEAVQICGLDCTVAGANTCVAGSAIELARALNPSSSNPVSIEILTGSHNECISLVDLTDVTINNYGDIHPDAFTVNPNGGIIRIGNKPTILNAQRITLNNYGIIQNDGGNFAPEAAVLVGCEGSGQCATAFTPTWDWITINNFGKIIGHQSAISWRGNTNPGPSVYAPHLKINSPGLLVGGFTTLEKRPSSEDVIYAPNVVSRTNYCQLDNDIYNGAWGGTVQTSGSNTTTTAVLEGADRGPRDNSFQMRMIRFTGGSCPCNGGKSQIISSHSNDDIVGFYPACAAAPDNTCTYAVDAVYQGDTQECSIEWPAVPGTIPRNSVAFTVPAGGASTPADRDSVTFTRGSNFQIQLNNTTFLNDPCAGGASHVARSIAAGAATPAQNGPGKVILDGVDIALEINADQIEDPAGAPSANCERQIFGVGTVNPNAVSGTVYFDGTVRILNRAEPDKSTTSFFTNGGVGTSLELGHVFTDLQNPVAAYTGTASTLHATTAGGSLKVSGELDSPQLIKTNLPNQVTGWASKAFTLNDVGLVGYTDYPLPINNELVGIQLQAAACSCKGTCGAAETVNLTDGAGNAIATLTCTDNQTALSFTDITGDSDALLPTGEQPEVDSGTSSGTAGDDTVIFLHYTSNRWVN